MNSCKSSLPFPSISGRREEKDEGKLRGRTGERGKRKRAASERQNAALDLKSVGFMLERHETVLKHMALQMYSL
jgi:hypothetical protein